MAGRGVLQNNVFMKIRSKKKDRASLSRSRRSSHSSEEDGLTVDFVHRLQEASAEQARDLLDRFLLDVDAAAEAMIKHPSPETLSTYKKTVGWFLDAALSKSYQVRVRPGKASQGQQKLHVILESVDEQMSALAESIVNGQSKSFNLIEKLDEIRGLLLDLYL